MNLYELYTTKESVTWMSSSAGLWGIRGRTITGPIVATGHLNDSKGKSFQPYIKTRSFLAEDSIRSMAQGPDSIFYFVTYDNMFLWRPDGKVNGWGFPPFNINKSWPSVLKIWINSKGDIYAGTRQNFYVILGGGIDYRSWKKYDFGADKDSNYVVTNGAKTIIHIPVGNNAEVYSFAQDAIDSNKIWIGTNQGLFYFEDDQKTITPVSLINNNIRVTEIYTGEKDNIWFSTLETGMGVYNITHQTINFYPYKKISDGSKNSIKTFCYKSPGKFFVAIMDSLPAVFSTSSRTYLFINDSMLNQSPNYTKDIKTDQQGNLIILKGGSLYLTNITNNEFLRTELINNSADLAPFISKIEFPDGVQIASLDYYPDRLKEIKLKYNQNNLNIYYDVNNFGDKKNIRFAWKIEGFTNGWVEMPSLDMDDSRVAFIENVIPGKYLLQVKVKLGNEDWKSQMAELIIIIEPPFWLTWWFWACSIGVIGLITYFIIKQRIKSVRKQEQLKTEFQKQALELEAKALRSQMNPHFIYNCMNSIKALMQEKDVDKGITYLTTFSKLIRTLFQNCDKRQISLYDEIETCRLYAQLEVMRLNGKLKYSFDIDPNLDLKSVMVPALIIQPFIENAIWHGIIPKERGTVKINVRGDEDVIVCEMDDDGIGREMSKRNKPSTPIIHESSGVRLSQARLDLEKMLNETNASIEIIDKYESSVATGTKVILKFNQAE